MFYTADLHTHSHYAKATSKFLNLETLYQWAQIKGIQVIGTGDFTHPGWFKELKEKLEPDGSGLFRLKEPPVLPALPGIQHSDSDPRFCLSTEISCEYMADHKKRVVHNLVYVPDFSTAEQLIKKLTSLTDLALDGRPTIGISSRDLLEIVLSTSDRSHLVPAHAWTPWNAALGSINGYDSIEACYRDLAPFIFALETGLSSDPAMNWQLSAHDRYAMMSSSDAHSPQKLGREVNLFDTERSYDGLFNAVKTGKGFKGTYEFFPEEGKYSYDGHRNCGVSLSPDESNALNNTCPVCKRTVTIGVMNTVAKLSDRAAPKQPATAPGFEYIIPLPEILSEIHGTAVDSKKVTQVYIKTISAFGNEFNVLKETSTADIGRYNPMLAEAIRRMRAGEVNRVAGYDGVYGKITVFDKEAVVPATAQLTMF